MFNEQMLENISENMPEFPDGSVWLIGAGPGHIGLMTMMGMYGLMQADVIIYDALVNIKLLDFAKKGADKLYAGKRGGKPSATQQNITETIIKHAKEGKKVVRLKGGDPFIFGRGGEEIESLSAENIQFLAISGITAGIGGLAFANIPATSRETNQTITFLTGHDAKGIIPNAINWDALAKGSQTIVMYMALKNIEEICERLIEGGKPADSAVAIVRNATLEDQENFITNLGECASFVREHKIKPPAILVIGGNVNIRERVIKNALPFYQ